MKRYIKASTNDDIILYRSGSVDPNIVSSSKKGVFFATDEGYFHNHNQMTFTEPYKRYLLLPNARVWDPAKEFEVYDAESWGRIVCLMTDLEKFGLEDEYDGEVDEAYGATSTDGLAEAGKKLGYDATVIRDIWYAHGYFDEYAVYNPSVIKPL